jgi:hypothetical protein
MAAGRWAIGANTGRSSVAAGDGRCATDRSRRGTHPGHGHGTSGGGAPLSTPTLRTRESNACAQASA